MSVQIACNTIACRFKFIDPLGTEQSAQRAHRAIVRDRPAEILRRSVQERRGRDRIAPYGIFSGNR